MTSSPSGSAPESPRASRRRRSLMAGVAALAVVAALSVIGANSGWFGGVDRQAVVAERGAHVMPFDLDATTHHFAPHAEGGLQTVVADDPSDQDQIALIQQHLQEEAEAFRRGDFGDPARIHGADMPGLAALQAGAGRFDVEYRPRDDGAELSYTTDDPVLVAVLHDWFAAQTSDHGQHAG
jgi:hypothetical protein